MMDNASPQTKKAEPFLTLLSEAASPGNKTHCELVGSHKTLWEHNQSLTLEDDLPYLKKGTIVNKKT
jgi:hypothetical protein